MRAFRVEFFCIIKRAHALNIPRESNLRLFIYLMSDEKTKKVQGKGQNLLVDLLWRTTLRDLELQLKIL